MDNVLKVTKRKSRVSESLTNDENQSNPITPISLVVAFCGAPKQPLSIDELQTLSLDQQLDILNIAKIHDAESRGILIRNLCAQLPALRDSAINRHRFQSVLSEFYQRHNRLNHLLFSPAEWDQTQIPLSLFCYSMGRLRRQPLDDDDAKEYTKEMQSAEAMWMFIDYLRKYCDEEEWTGKKMKELCDRITENGQKPNDFAFHFQYLIINRYKVDIEKYKRRRIRKTIQFWYQKVFRVETVNDGMTLQSLHSWP